MCVQYREGGSYNKYPIDDILVDKYNFDKYRENGIIGNRIVACTFGNMNLIQIVFYELPR